MDYFQLARDPEELAARTADRFRYATCHRRARVDLVFFWIDSPTT
jgi:hypothetical protein